MESLAIASDTVVTLTYALFDEHGTPIERLFDEVREAGEAGETDETREGPEPVTYIHGYAQIVPGIERQVEGLRAGDKRTLTVPPDEAFGERDEEAMFEVDKADFPNADRVAVGDEFVAEDEDGDHVVMRVVELRGDGFLVDTNHPLAGRTLRVEVAVNEVRAATEEEIAAAQAALEGAAEHDACGCGHDHHDGEHHDHAHDATPLVQLGKKG